MTTEKFAMLWEVLEKYNFADCSDIPDKLKCLKCKNILKKPCQVPCGCKFCFNCIADILGNGFQKCIGNSEDCENSYLSKFALDYKINKKISALELNCPIESCSHRCELISMSEHLRVCSKNYNNCPFYEFGCVALNVNSNKISEHLNDEHHSHSKIIVEMMGRLNNEITRLNAIIKVKDEKIESMNRELAVIYKLINEIGTEIDFKLDGLKQECREFIDQKFNAQNEANKKLQQQTTTSWNAVQRSLMNLFIGTYEWVINFTDVENFQHGNSDYFSCVLHSYKMVLAFDLSPRVFRIYLEIHCGMCDDTLLWPFQATVTIKVVCPQSPDNCQIQTKFCIIQRPSIDNNSQSSEAFKFSYDHLRNIGIIQNECCLIQCFIQA